MIVYVPIVGYDLVRVVVVRSRVVVLTLCRPQFDF